MQLLKAAACLIVLTGGTAAAAVMTADGGEQTTVKRAQVAPMDIAGGGRLGISVREVEDEDVKTARLAGAAGAVVDEVSEGSAAEKAGLRKGDVIVEFDGERVRSVRQLSRLVRETADGRKVPAIVMRDAQRVTLTVEPQEGGGLAATLHDLEDWGRNFKLEVPARPAIPQRGRAATPSPWRMEEFISPSSGRLGLTVDALSPQLADYFGTKQGVLVTSVTDNSAAAKAGIRAGDVITSVNGSAVDDPAELRRRLQPLSDGAEFTIAVMRDKKAQTLKGKFEPRVRKRTFRSVI
jgi:serine protease Do